MRRRAFSGLLTVKKVEAGGRRYGATTAGGSHSSAFRARARYGVFCNGTQVAWILSVNPAYSYRDPGTPWKVIRVRDQQEVKRIYGGGFDAAKRWALDHLREECP